MKKVLVFILIMSGLACFAQDQHKPEKGNFTTELQFSPFAINVKVDYYDEIANVSTGPFSMSGLRFRYFFSEKLALRTTLGFDFDHDKTVRNLDETIDEWYYKYVITGEYTEKSRSSMFSIAPGLEYHFGNWERMSLYVGGELFFGITTSKSTIDENIERLYYERSGYGTDDYVYVKKIETEKSIETKNCRREYDDWYGYGRYVQNAPMAFGINALLGMDFYIYKGLYMGAEFGFGYSYQTYLKGSHKESSKITTTLSGGRPDTVENTKEDKVEDKVSSGNFSVRYNPMIRLGWKF
jgi:hypothetical protein